MCSPKKRNIENTITYYFFVEVGFLVTFAIFGVFGSFAFSIVGAVATGAATLGSNNVTIFSSFWFMPSSLEFMASNWLLFWSKLGRLKSDLSDRGESKLLLPIFSKHSLQ